MFTSPLGILIHSRIDQTLSRFIMPGKEHNNAPAPSSSSSSESSDDDEKKTTPTNWFTPKIYTYYPQWRSLKPYPHGDSSRMFPPLHVIERTFNEDNYEPRKSSKKNKTAAVAAYRLAGGVFVVEIVIMWSGRTFTQCMHYTPGNLSKFKACLTTCMSDGEYFMNARSRRDVDDDQNVLWRYDEHRSRWQPSNTPKKKKKKNRRSASPVASMTQALRGMSPQDAAPAVTTRSTSFGEQSFGMPFTFEGQGSWLPTLLQRVKNPNLTIVDVVTNDDSSSVEWLESIDQGRTAYAVQTKFMEGSEDLASELVQALNEKLMSL